MIVSINALSLGVALRYFCLFTPGRVSSHFLIHRSDSYSLSPFYANQSSSRKTKAKHSASKKHCIERTSTMAYNPRMSTVRQTPYANKRREQEEDNYMLIVSNLVFLREHPSNTIP